MGIYTSNRHTNEAYDYISDIPVNEAYGAALGCAQIIADCQMNDMTLFENAIYSDFKEVKAIQEGYGYVNENAFTSLIHKIIESVKNILGKIKGIFASFFTKISASFKDNKELVEKYQKKIDECKNWNGFEIDGIRVPVKENVKESINEIFDIGTTKTRFDYNFIPNSKEDDNTHFTEFDITQIRDNKFGSIKSNEDVMNAEPDDIKNELLKLYIKNISESKYDITKIKDILINELFESEKTFKISDSKELNVDWIKKTLIESKDWIDQAKKFNETLNYNINAIINALKADEKIITKFINDNGKDAESSAHMAPKTYVSKYDADGKIQTPPAVDMDELKAPKEQDDFKIKNSQMQSAVRTLQKIASAEQDVIVKLTSEYLSTVNFTIKQARKIWGNAIAWTSSVHKESVEFANATGDVIAEQFSTIMESY